MEKITNFDIVRSPVFDGTVTRSNMGMERATIIILVSTDSALIRQYQFTSLKQCKLNFTYRGKFP